jgi:type III restriction enzyme
MAQKIKFEFNDKLTHQLNAIDSTVGLFKGLPINNKGLYSGSRFLADDNSANPRITLGSRILDNLKQIQLDNDIFPDNELYNGDFVIEMETGTGKTYVYLRTILQLHQEYGFKKFMIIVPSIAIKMGVKKSVEMLKDHFQTIFNIDLLKHFYIYDSKNIQGLLNTFVESKDLSICLMNTQAFASDSTKIKNAQESGIVLWEELKGIKPIVIIDEPQRVEGTKKKPSKSKQALDELNPLFTLKYSATHKDEFKTNFIYKLDSYGAFANKLVKSIKVKTVYGTIPKDFPYIRYIRFTKDLKAKIEIFSQEQGGRIKFKTFEVLGSQSIYELSGGLSQYKDYYVTENPRKDSLKISTSDSNIILKEGECNTTEVNQDKAVRIQIQLAIKNHFEKQFAILERGEKIKTLTLFFIDEVIKVRDENAPDTRGEYLKIFDEEYAKLIKDYKDKFAKYSDLFPNYENIEEVRQGYFAKDKQGKIMNLEVLEEGKEYTKATQELVDKQIDLILNGKDELISFNSPLAFIFSHSALREGWDNPNVFTLCTLRKGNSDIAKKQEIGRGLRLPVDINGKRIQDEEINELTVIANDSYDEFASTLQKDFNEKMGFNKDEVTFDIITKTLKKAGIPADKMTKELVDEFKNELFTCSVIDNKNMLKNEAKNLQYVDFSNDILKEHEIKIKEAFIELMQEKGSNKLPIENGDNEPIINEQCSYIEEARFKKLLDTLRHYMVKRSVYKFDFNQDEFIANCTKEINEYLKNIRATNVFEITEGKVNASIEKITVDRAGNPTQQEVYKDSIKEPKTNIEIIDNIMYHTMMPRKAIFRILNGIEKRDLLDYQDILEDVTKKIAKLLVDTKAENIVAYEVIDGYELDWAKIIETDIVDDESFNKVKRVFKTNLTKQRALNKYYKMDSDGEYDFAEQLENDNSVILFTKLKKGGFIIDTPYGNYSPDWAVIVKEESTQDHKMYFIIESKFNKDESTLSDIEKNKIEKCGRLHFKAVDKSIKFDWINSYSDYKRKFGIISVM